MDEGRQVEKRIQTLCGICPSGCTVTAVVKGGKLERILPNPDSPRGVLCVRGAASKEIVYSHLRLTKPLKRVGPKGEEACLLYTSDAADE